jgi:hypothetical protein
MSTFGFGRQVTAKLANMRKPQEFTVMPADDGETVIVQSDKSIGRFNMRTGEGILNTKGAYFPHLSKMLGAVPYIFPAEFVRDCLDACPSLDGQTSFLGGAVIVQHTVKSI